MKITEIRFQKASFRFAQPMKVAFAVMEGYETLLVKVETDEGLWGLGEAAPLGFVTGDSIGTALCVGQELRELLLGCDPLAMGELHRRMDGRYNYNTSIKAAIDMACYDIAAKRMGVPLYRFLGGEESVLESDVTIGIASPSEMAQKASEWVLQGFRILKIKLGEEIGTDLKRMQKIREAVGKDVTLRVDANQGWTVKDALWIIRELESLGVELVEQPLVAWDEEGMRELTQRTMLPIVADESCHSPMDASRLVRNRAVDGINIKLMKCGGIYQAEKIHAIGEAAGIFCMIGCMGESPVANTAAMHFAAASPNVKKIDLDVVFFASRDERIHGGFTYEGGICTLPQEPGLGIWVDGF